MPASVHSTLLGGHCSLHLGRVVHPSNRQVGELVSYFSIVGGWFGGQEEWGGTEDKVGWL
jgi:hypothetical protein